MGDKSEGKRALLFGKIIISVIIFKVYFQQFSEEPGEGFIHTQAHAHSVFEDLLSCSWSKYGSREVFKTKRIYPVPEKDTGWRGKLRSVHEV